MGTVTVNGKPLDQVISERANGEILENLQKSNKYRRQPLITQRAANHSKTRTSSGYVVYRADQKEQKVIIKGQVFDWKDKAPFERAGFSLFGATEMTEDGSQVKCAECGDWVEAIDVHVKKHDRMTARSYRLKYGLNLKSKLCSPAVQAKRKRVVTGRNFTADSGKKAARSAVSAKTETRDQRRAVKTGRTYGENDNLKYRCEAQRIADLQQLAKQVGRTPTCREMNHFINPRNNLKTLKVNDIKAFFGVSLPAILIRAGLTPRTSKRL